MSDFETRFLAARNAVIDFSLARLNDAQRQAAKATEGPLLILAGAGSGKTTVLIHRIACLLRFGRASDSSELPPMLSEEDVEFLERYVRFRSPEDRARAEALCALEPAAPWEVLAITFTNKAAGELVARLEAMLGEEANDIWASTFHSACVRILRRDVQHLGLYGRDFTIYDTADCQSLLKRILKDLDLDEKRYPPRAMLSAISAAKGQLQLPEDCRKEAGMDVWRKTIAEVYTEYRKRMLQADAMDFDDLLLNTVLLLEQCPEVLKYYQRKFRYVLVDEYQDTSMLQYKLVSLLAGRWKNLGVVGDDDQGIYKFRGATIQNILEFEEDYSNARVVKLEQNYRSTGHILGAANAVISRNTERKGKTLWTDNGMGETITLYTAMNENDEAQYIAGQMLNGVSTGGSWQDYAILYRVNALSNRLEYALKRNAIPYRIYGGTRFYDRAEIKDMLAYLCVVANPNDDLRLRRIVNNPPRGIGETALQRAAELAERDGKSLYTVLSQADSYPELARSAKYMKAFTAIIEEVRARRTETLDVLYDVLVERSGYLKMLEVKDTQENITRAENVRELKTNIISFVKERSGVGTLEDFLDEMALYSDTDEMGKEGSCVSLMTMHSAKGLEFPTVFLAGVEDGLFPNAKSIGEPEELEEERRLCYVAITRAKEKLHICNARQRMVFGKTQNNKVSRFVNDIPEEHLRRLPEARQQSWGQSSEGRSTQSDSFGSYGTSGSYGEGRSRNSGWSPAPARSAPRASKPMNYTPAAAKSSPAQSFRVGDTVEHKAFGRGTVLSATAMGPDCILEIAFESSGTKKLMQSSAGKFMKKAE